MGLLLIFGVKRKFRFYCRKKYFLLYSNEGKIEKMHKIANYSISEKLQTNIMYSNPQICQQFDKEILDVKFFTITN